MEPYLLRNYSRYKFLPIYKESMKLWQALEATMLTYESKGNSFYIDGTSAKCFNPTEIFYLDLQQVFILFYFHFCDNLHHLVISSVILNY